MAIFLFFLLFVYCYRGCFCYCCCCYIQHTLASLSFVRPEKPSFSLQMSSSSLRIFFLSRSTDVHAKYNFIFAFVVFILLLLHQSTHMQYTALHRRIYRTSVMYKFLFFPLFFFVSTLSSYLYLLIIVFQLRYRAE